MFQDYLVSRMIKFKALGCEKISWIVKIYWTDFFDHNMTPSSFIFFKYSWKNFKEL